MYLILLSCIIQLKIGDKYYITFVIQVTIFIYTDIYIYICDWSFNQVFLRWLITRGLLSAHAVVDF